MQRLSYPTEIVLLLSNKITRNRIVPSFKDSPRKPLGRRPNVATERGGMNHKSHTLCPTIMIIIGGGGSSSRVWPYLHTLALNNT